MARVQHLLGRSPFKTECRHLPGWRPGGGKILNGGRETTSFLVSADDAGANQLVQWLPPNGQVHIGLRGCNYQAKMVEAIELGKKTRKRRKIEQRSTRRTRRKGHIELECSFPCSVQVRGGATHTAFVHACLLQASAVLKSQIAFFFLSPPINNERHHLRKMPQNIGTRSQSLIQNSVEEKRLRLGPLLALDTLRCC